MNIPSVKETIQQFKKSCGCVGSCDCNVSDIKKDLREAAHNAGEKMRELYDAASGESRDAIATARKQIRSNPLAASAIAAGVGFVLAALLRRR